MKTKAGIGLVILGVAVFASWKIWVATRHRVPLDVPLALNAERTLAEDFRLNLSGLYLIDLAADPELAPEIQRCLFGGAPNSKQCQPAIDASWILYRGGQELLRGSSAEPHSAPSAARDAMRVIGEFPGQAGSDYHLLVTVNANGSALEELRPRLRVEVSGLARSDFQSANILVFSITFICLLFGAVLLGIAWRVA
jgi:hypothetical protein